MSSFTSREGPSRTMPSRPEPTVATKKSQWRPSVLVLNRSYWPDMEATGQLLTELCEDLSSDFQLTVVAGQPHVTSTNSYRSVGSQSKHGVQIHRVWHTRFAKGHLLGRALNLMTYLFAAALRSVMLTRPHIVVVETDPPFLTCLGLILRLRYRCRLVVYMQDVYPDVALAVGKLRSGIIVNTVRALLYRSYRAADKVVVLCEDMRERMLEIGIRPDRIVCIPNWADTRKLFPNKRANLYRERHGLNNSFVVMYSGNLGLTQRLENVLLAARQLHTRSDIRFVLVGGGVERVRLEKLAKSMNLTNVIFDDYQPKRFLTQTLSAGDIHLVPLAADLTKCLMPSKLYGVMATGSPVVAISPPDCELGRIVSENEIGLVCPPENPERLAEVVLWCASNPSRLQQMGKAARRLCVRRFDRSQSTSEFARILTQLVGQAARALSETCTVSQGGAPFTTPTH